MHIYCLGSNVHFKEQLQLRTTQPPRAVKHGENHTPGTNCNFHVASHNIFLPYTPNFIILRRKHSC